MKLAGIVLFLAAVAAWSFDPGSEARRLEDRDPPEVVDLLPVLQSVPVALTTSRIVRVAIDAGRSSVDLELRGSWLAPDGHKLTGKLSARAEGSGLALSSGAWSRSEGAKVDFEPEKGTFCLGSKCYRGSVHLEKIGGGIVVVNRVVLEEYLLGVLPGEIGRKLDSHFYEAVRAQAIVARTYTLRSIGQYSSKAWDVHDDVRDQVYDGMKGEDSLCSRAVRSTRGQILVDGQGKPIDAYYHSTSGGHTADIADIWPQKPPQAYLRGVADTAFDGRAWGGASLAAEWTEHWPINLLHDSIRRDLSEALGRKVDPGKVTSVRLEGRDSSGRAKKLVVVGEKGTFEVPSDRIRWALRRQAKGRPILRSSRFELEIANGEYLAEGTGYGHGVGMSQNGAMGRAFAGQTCQQILSAYYPGTVLRTLE